MFSASARGTSMDAERVLIIDDDPFVVETYAAAFESSGFQVHTAESGTAGFAVLQVFRPDVVILDLNMPGSGGLDWLAAARRLPALENLPVVVVTGAAPDSPEVKAAMDAGVQGVLYKKLWNPEALVAAARWASSRRHEAPRVL